MKGSPRAGTTGLPSKIGGDTLTTLANGSDPYLLAVNETTLFWANTAGGTIVKLAK